MGMSVVGSGRPRQGPVTFSAFRFRSTSLRSAGSRYQLGRPVFGPTGGSFVLPGVRLDRPGTLTLRSGNDVECACHRPGLPGSLFRFTGETRAGVNPDASRRSHRPVRGGASGGEIGWRNSPPPPNPRSAHNSTRKSPSSTSTAPRWASNGEKSTENWPSTSPARPPTTPPRRARR